MKLTSKGNYAIVAMLDIAMHSTSNHIPLKEVALRLELSENYLRQLFMLLGRKGLISSVRGGGGGYYLKLEPKEIHILQIVEAVEGRITLVPCLEDEEINCNRETICSAKSVWATLNNSIVKGLDQLTLQDLIDEYKLFEGVEKNGE